MKTKDFTYYEKALRECADLEAFTEIVSGIDATKATSSEIAFALMLAEAKQKRIELLNGLLESIGKTPF